MDHTFKEQKGRIDEVYIDDMVIKSRRVEDHARDIAKAFDVLNRAGIKLNLNKCTFRVKAGNFLNFMISERGIEVNPMKI